VPSCRRSSVSSGWLKVATPIPRKGRGGHFLPRTNRSFDATLPPKQNVGRLYPAKPGIARRRAGPCIAFNLRIGRTTKCVQLRYDH
jgi:hypothetical protein